MYAYIYIHINMPRPRLPTPILSFRTRHVGLNKEALDKDSKLTLGWLLVPSSRVNRYGKPGRNVHNFGGNQ